jgi:hypothetical protein
MRPCSGRGGLGEEVLVWREEGQQLVEQGPVEGEREGEATLIQDGTNWKSKKPVKRIWTQHQGRRLIESKSRWSDRQRGARIAMKCNAILPRTLRTQEVLVTLRWTSHQLRAQRQQCELYKDRNCFNSKEVK